MAFYLNLHDFSLLFHRVGMEMLTNRNVVVDMPFSIKETGCVIGRHILFESITPYGRLLVLFLHYDSINDRHGRDVHDVAHGSVKWIGLFSPIWIGPTISISSLFKACSNW